MGRKLRIEYAGAIYHVIQRGNNKEIIFKENKEKEFLIDDIVKRKISYGYKLLGYVIMDNHYHLLIQTLDKSLQKIMHGINNRYSKYFNYKNKRTGHLFEGRYKAIPVQDESYLLSLIRYIHQNPVRAGMYCNAKDYEWSSDYCYRNNKGDKVDIEIILDTISFKRKNAIMEYTRFIEELEENDYEGVEKLGNEAFDMHMESKKSVHQRKRLDEILIDTGISQEDFRLIKQGSRKRNLTPYKMAYTKEATKINYTLKEIGANINLSDVAVFKLLEKR